jgi:perosamine synthetase
MHTFGHPVDMEGVLALARDFNLEVIEDATESLGSTIHGKHAGTFGRMGVLSFNGNKVITTGGGGAILTDDPELAKHAKHLTTTAKLQHRWAYVHDEIGYNYRLPNINAALGCAQLEQLPGFVDVKRKLYERYRAALDGIPHMRLFAEPEGCQSNYWLQTLLLDESAAGLRDELLQATNDAGLMTRPVWQLMNRLPAYQSCPSMPLSVSESLEKRIINLPSSVTLGGA